MKQAQIEQTFQHELQSLIASGVWDPYGDFQAIAKKYISSDEVLSESDVACFRSDLKERAHRIPLGHILGYSDFIDCRFVVGTGVFVPRQQSAMLLEWLKTQLHAESEAVIYDLCSGTGAIGISAWRQYRNATVYCLENDETAYQYLCRNIHRLADEGSVVALKKDITDLTFFLDKSQSVDVVISNPPYVPESESLLPEWGKYHPENAIYSGQDGSEIIDASLRLAEIVLKPGGTVIVEHGESQIPMVQDLFSRYQFESVLTHTDPLFSDQTGPAVMTVGTKK
ncbi:peptide chain release factor N(5)-glutamine methyltransferase [Photobacterium sp. WH24]|uniref:Peptide chain release factor N(5)-glutamine methyltransferase n=1 Tax=Photobacterium arenosum TaxID=2774143 RepID=A0ABR9BN05_9GAMM|nr:MULTISPECIES: HemK/PrmC family methyltransferase [Photobacterium]MBD8512841.1 peptide chain release factor N(5)-glutamine methyltransferase [Photobacterium arenosum]MBV7261071.1 peptide chain release factor N(5)-glutamine methyltransferase [Photobacterium sp. WH24]